MGDPKGFLKTQERELPKRRPVPVRIMDWKEVYENQDPAQLRRQAGRCMDCGIPFCHQGCPLGNLIPLRDNDEKVLRGLLESHRDWTESPVAERLLESWAESRNRFTVVLPRDYQRVLDVRTAAEAEGLDLDGAEVWERIMEASRG